MPKDDVLVRNVGGGVGGDPVGEVAVEGVGGAGSLGDVPAGGVVLGVVVWHRSLEGRVARLGCGRKRFWKDVGRQMRMV